MWMHNVLAVESHISVWRCKRMYTGTLSVRLTAGHSNIPQLACVSKSLTATLQHLFTHAAGRSEVLQHNTTRIVAFLGCPEHSPQHVLSTSLQTISPLMAHARCIPTIG